MFSVKPEYRKNRKDKVRKCHKHQGTESQMMRNMMRRLRRTKNMCQKIKTHRVEIEKYDEKREGVSEDQDTQSQIMRSMMRRQKRIEIGASRKGTEMKNMMK